METSASAIVTWKVEDDFYSVKESRKCIKSPIFKVSEKYCSNWVFSLYPYGRYEQNETHVFLDLTTIPHDCWYQHPVQVKVHIAAFGEKEKLADIMTTEDYMEDMDGWDLFPRSKLDEANKEQVTISCYIQVYVDFQETFADCAASRVPLNSTSCAPPVPWNIQFQKYLWYMRENSKVPDFVIKISSIGEHIPVHRVVLAAKSDVFKAAFINSSMVESKTNSISTEFSYECMLKLVEFIYLGTLEKEKLKDIVLEMYQAADYYKVENLKNLCINAICEILDTENVIQILEFAWNHTLKSLIQKCIEILRSNMDKIESEECENISLKNRVLYNYIHKEVAKKTKIGIISDFPEFQPINNLNNLMWELRCKNVLTDFKIECKYGIVELHKIVFDCYISVSSLRDFRGCEINALDFSQRSFHILVKYIYTGKLDVSPSEISYALELLKMADHFRLGIMIYEIQECLISLLNPDTVVDIFYASWKPKTVFFKLERACIHFLGNNPEIVETKKYLDILSNDREFFRYANKTFATLVKDVFKNVHSSLQIIQL